MLKANEKIFLNNISHPHPNLSPIQHANFDSGKLDTLHVLQDALHTQGGNTACDSCGMLLKQGTANEQQEQEINSMGKDTNFNPRHLSVTSLITYSLFCFNLIPCNHSPIPVFLLSYMQKLSSETIKQGCQFYKKQASIRNCIKHWQPTQQQHSIFLNVLLIVDPFLHHFKHQQWSLQLLLQAQYWWMSDDGTVKGT